jgi:hypothetical protein
MLMSSRPIRKSPALSNAEIKKKHNNYRERRRFYSQTQPPPGHVIIIRAYGIPAFFHTQPVELRLMTSRGVSLESRVSRDSNLFTRSKYDNPPQLFPIITTEG